MIQAILKEAYFCIFKSYVLLAVEVCEKHSIEGHQEVSEVMFVMTSYTLPSC